MLEDVGYGAGKIRNYTASKNVVIGFNRHKYVFDKYHVSFVKEIT